MALTKQDIQQIENLKNKYFKSLEMEDNLKQSAKWAKKLNDKEKELMRILLISYGLFTTGWVDAVRDPSLIKKNPRMISYKKILPKYFTLSEIGEAFLQKIGLDYSIDVTLEDYQNAHDLLSVVSGRQDSQTQNQVNILYRGMYNISQNLLQTWIQKGTTFDLGNIVSCTWDEDMAVYLANIWPISKPIRVLLIINNENNIGTVASNVSKFPEQKEAILSGQIKTTKVEGLKLKLIDGVGFEAEVTNDPDLIVSTMMIFEEIEDKIDKFISKKKNFKFKIGDYTLDTKTEQGKNYLSSIRYLSFTLPHEIVKIWVDLI